MPAKSKAQQKFMGMVHAAQKGEKAASTKVAKVAKRMKKKDAEDYASTKHKGKPEHVPKKEEVSVNIDKLLKNPKIKKIMQKLDIKKTQSRDAALKILNYFAVNPHALAALKKVAFESTNEYHKFRGKMTYGDNKLKKGDKFNHDGVSWIVTQVGSSQSKAKVTTKSSRGKSSYKMGDMEVIDNKLIHKESVELNFPGKIGKFAEILKVNEVAPKGWEGTVKAMKDEKGIDNPWALAWWMKKKGYKSHKEVKEGAIFAVKGKSGPGGHKKANKPPFKYDPEK